MTEPLPTVSGWEADEKRNQPWNPQSNPPSNPYDTANPYDTPHPFGAPAADTASPPSGPGPTAERFGTPAAYTGPTEADVAPRGPFAPPPEPPPTAWNPGGPGTPPGPGAEAPPGQENATLNLGVPPGPPPEPGAEPAPWHQPFPPGETPPGGTTTKRNTPLLVAGIAAAVAVLGVGLAYALTQGTPWSDKKQPASAQSSAAAQGAEQQASVVNKILDSGKAARRHLPDPLRTCDDVAAGVPGFQQVVRDRQQALSRSKSLKVDQLQNGSRLRRSMIIAYQSSLDADQAYLAWAQEIQARNCGHKIAPLTAHYKDAISANGKAGPAKRQVVALWKPIATNHNLPTYVWNHL